MFIESTRFGHIEIDESLLFTFPRGMPGFEGERQFAVIERQGQRFKWLQSVEDAELAFLVADPHYFLAHYEATLPKGDLALLKIRFPEDLAMAVILNVPPARPAAMTVNLRAPILFNIRERLGTQIILTSQRYPVDFAAIREWRQEGERLEQQSAA